MAGSGVVGVNALLEPDDCTIIMSRAMAYKVDSCQPSGYNLPSVAIELPMANTPRLMFMNRQADRDARVLSLLGLPALLEEMRSQGVAPQSVLAGSGVQLRQFDDPKTLVSRTQRLTIYRNAQRLTKRSDVALLAGARQRISDFGIYGYAIASSKTLGDALALSFRHLPQAGAILQITSRIEEGAIKLRSHDHASLGALLPFVAEFWRSSNVTFLGRVLEAPFPSRRMLLPYPAPVHWRSYRKIFNCPIEFDAGVMEWHIDEASWTIPLPNANSSTAAVCQRFCEQLLADQPKASILADSIRAILVNQPGRFANAEEIASHLGMSLRTLHRRLASDQLSYQSIIDDVRKTLAIEYLEHTSMSIEDICERVGFSDTSNFRKAFRKWTGGAPSDFRQETIQRQ